MEVNECPLKPPTYSISLVFVSPWKSCQVSNPVSVPLLLLQLHTTLQDLSSFHNILSLQRLCG